MEFGRGSLTGLEFLSQLFDLLNFVLGAPFGVGDPLLGQNDLSELYQTEVLAIEVFLFGANQVLFEILHNMLLCTQIMLSVAMLHLLIHLSFLLDDFVEEFLGMLM